MGVSTISLGLGLGGGKAATSSGRLAGGGAFKNQYSVSFDGTDDHLNVPHDSSLNLSSAGTFSVWVNMNTTHTVDYPYLFAKWAGSDENYTFFTKVTGQTAGKFIMRYWDGSSALSSSTEINRGVWVHLAATLDGSNLIYYVNGSADNTVSMGMGTTNTGDLKIGIHPSDIRPFPGLMDEAAIFNTKLSAAQISNIYKGEESGGSGGTNGVPGDLSTFNPVAWWRMGDGTEAGSGTTVYDMSSNSNNGTLTNGPTFSTDVPTFNQYSVSLDGSDDYMDIPDSTALETTAFTWSAWFYCTAIDRYNIIVDTATNSSFFNGYEIFVKNNDNKIRFASYHSSDAIDSTTIVSANTWFHVAATHESGSDKLYVNGTLEASGSASSFNVTDAANLRIGSSSIFSLYHQGLIDEVSFFNSALSAPDISTLRGGASAGTLGVPADISSLNPVGWWRMGDNDGGTGTTITNQGSASSIDGTLTNGPTFSTNVPT
jgi:hypothetical protein